MLTPPSYRPERRRRLFAAPAARRFGRDFQSECKYRHPSWLPRILVRAWPKRSRGSERRCKIRLPGVGSNPRGDALAATHWLGELENVNVGHGVSLLRWRSGGFEHPHDTPPYPFMPSPTFEHSSAGSRTRFVHPQYRPFPGSVLIPSRLI